MFTAVQRIDFVAGHRLMNHQGGCASVHGHNYTAYLHIAAPELDDQDMVVDFYDIKKDFLEWIERNWDHAFICNAEDKTVLELLSALPKQKIFTLVGNPTAENLANFLLREVGPTVMRNQKAKLNKVVLYETFDSYVEVS
ncbi:MAG: 6-carboxytetrahydropterin synthase [Deltaproteobacteria bacterium]|nr:6-carboxytetrahydropterin synthase [Deltaproteobacteria bacterium]